MKDGFKIIVLLIILVAMVAGFWYLFKDNHVFDHNKKDETRIEQKADTVDKVKDVIKQESKKEDVTKKAEAAKKEETRKTGTKTTTKTENKKENTATNKTDTSQGSSSNNNSNTEMVFKSYSKPRCVFTGEEENYNYIMTYEGYFDTQNSYLMDKVTINLQYGPKEGKLEATKKEAQEQVKEHPGFNGGYVVKEGYVIVNLSGTGKTFSKVYMDGAVDNVNQDTFLYIMKLSGATCYA